MAPPLPIRERDEAAAPQAAQAAHAMHDSILERAVRQHTPDRLGCAGRNFSSPGGKRVEFFPEQLGLFQPLYGHLTQRGVVFCQDERAPSGAKTRAITLQNCAGSLCLRDQRKMIRVDGEIRACLRFRSARISGIRSPSQASHFSVALTMSIKCRVKITETAVGAGAQLIVSPAL